ncbi:MAG TPA: pyridoxamine 5'-phosphate oxidase [Stellaceae bacterium]|jgi:pyridoxamine 5'-phosphate oxidase|nr:pyridoxamine 5'-phosphate oxidase [Stellaceae bacterium]
MIDDIAETEPLAPFRRWWEAAAAREELAEAMSVATATAGGAPSLRMVLLRGLDERGFVFYTNFDSRKAADLAENPRAALCFHWKSFARQVRVEGRVSVVADAETDAYFHSRARESQIGAWASDQSRVLPDHATLMRRFEEATARFAGETVVPRPANWSGYRIAPDRVEFWQELPHRLHDRLVFIRDGGGWRRERLYP